MNAAVGLLQKYCGVAVGRNWRNFKDMRKAVLATFLTKHQQTAFHKAVPYRLRFVVWVAENKCKYKILLLQIYPATDSIRSS